MLKWKGAQTATDLAQQLKVSPMAIRQHLQNLFSEELVSYQELKQAVGRPLKLWQLTEKSLNLFPNHHADLIVQLLESVTSVFGELGLELLIQERTQAQIQAYLQQIAPHLNIREKANILAEIRTQEGYMAELIEVSKIELLLVENHCSICTAAQNCSLLCDSELKIFRHILGDEVQVERVEHILNGSRRCTYRIRLIQQSQIDCEQAANTIL
ncbi:helix-turn-helix transcriptional regulator [Calothrix sp. NIES-3974]|uniref:helix-turn-helix transcriptional regulator n=1 Tax=Calothrix sp. NIES-3974 TaxID=2005462 RepID=UPI001E2B81C7|nr:metalloregulator ArsR/SmtB family transcription factor [Calothrix sp. NIES-3974]